MKFKELQTKIIELTKRNISQADIAKALETTRSNISKRFNSGSPVNTDEIEKIEKFYNIKLVDYVSTPAISGAMRAVLELMSNEVQGKNQLKEFNNDYNKFTSKNYPENMPEMQEMSSNDSDCIEIEYIGIKPACGAGEIVIDEPEIRKIKLSNDLITHVLKCSHPDNLKVFQAKGDSMESLIEDGDLLLVDIGRTDIYNAGIYVFSIDNDWRVKRFRLRIDKTLEIISDNPSYDVEYIMPDSEIDLKIRGKVIKNLSRGL